MIAVIQLHVPYGGQIAQSTQDRTGPAPSDSALNNVADLDSFLVFGSVCTGGHSEWK